jgi:hypothetical protein
MNTTRISCLHHRHLSCDQFRKWCQIFILKATCSYDVEPIKSSSSRLQLSHYVTHHTAEFLQTRRHNYSKNSCTIPCTKLQLLVLKHADYNLLYTDCRLCRLQNPSKNLCMILVINWLLEGLHKIYTYPVTFTLNIIFSHLLTAIGSRSSLAVSTTAFHGSSTVATTIS